MRRRAAARKSLAEEMITPAPSIGGEERAAREVERGDRIVPVLRRLHRLDIQLVERAVDAFQKTDRRIGGGDSLFAEWDLVELPHTRNPLEYGKNGTGRVGTGGRENPK